MAWRDARRSRLALFSVFLAFATSLAVLSALVTFSVQLSRSVDDRSKELLGADFVLISRTKPAPNALEFLQAQPGLETRMIQTNTMLRAGNSDRLRIAQVRGVSKGFPIYGKIQSEPQVDLDTREGAIVDGRLLDQLALKIGDTIRMGSVELPILARLGQVPGEVGGYGMIAPRVYLPIEKLIASGLTGYGSQARYYFHYRTSGDVKSTLRGLRPQLSKLELDAESAEDREASVSKVTGAIGSYLQLAGFFAFILGGLGLNVSLRAFLQGKQSSIRILQVLGATRVQAASVFAVQALVIILIASCVGLGLGFLGMKIVRELLESLIPVGLTNNDSLMTNAGLLLLSILQSLTVLALLIYERRIQKSRALIQAASFVLPLLCSGAAALILIDRSKLVAFGFAGFIFGAALLYLCAYGASRSLERLTRLRLPYSIRFGFLQATRRFVSNSLIIMSVGAAVAVTVVSVEVRGAIAGKLDETLSGSRPNLFLFDIQPDQLEPARKLVSEHQLSHSKVVPVITMRLTRIGGTDVRELAEREPDRSKWVLRREYRTTYREAPIDSEKIVDGEFSGRASGGPVPISLERSIAKDLRVGIGGALTFEIQGVEIETTVGSIRDVNWKSGDVNFFVIFPAGVLEDAPQYFAMLARYGAADQLRHFEAALNTSFPNISVIDIREIFRGVEALLRQIGTIAEALALAVAVVASMILVSSLLGTLLPRARAEALLRAVGATSSFLSSARGVELSVISLIGVLAGLALGAIAAFLIVTQALELSASFNIGGILIGILPLALLPVVLGWIVGVLRARRTTMEVLRAE